MTKCDPKSASAQNLSKAIYEATHETIRYGFVNTPPYRGSTTLAKTVEDLVSANMPFTYGRRGNPSSQEFITIVKKLEKSEEVVLTTSGLSAISTALMSIISCKDHILVSDFCYHPTRHFCNQTLSRFGVGHDFVDTTNIDAVERMIRDNTKAIFLESPGSGTFEIDDIENIVALCKSKGIITLIDNTWATPLNFQPHEWGIDISIQAVTKYISGHADVNMGYISAVGDTAKMLKAYYYDSGFTISTDDIYLAMRGIRTLPTRLKQHEESALELVTWLETRDEVKQVIYPALPSSKYHERYKKYFSGAAGLFSVEFHEKYEKSAIYNALNTLKYFGYGFSWGGFESLVIPLSLSGSRSATDHPFTGQLARFQIGLEDVSLLKEDLEAALRTLS